MTFYIIKLLVLLPVMGSLIFGALWLYKKYQPVLRSPDQRSTVRVLESIALGPFNKLTVVEFDGKKVLLGVSKNNVSRLADCEPRP